MDGRDQERVMGEEKRLMGDEIATSMQSNGSVVRLKRRTRDGL